MLNGADRQGGAGLQRAGALQRAFAERSMTRFKWVNKPRNWKLEEAKNLGNSVRVYQITLAIQDLS